MTTSMKNPEPDFQAACQWWPNLPAVWTPIGWKDHMLRFNVFWNGALLAKGNNNRRTIQWADQGLLLTPLPASNAAQLGGVGMFIDLGVALVDDGMVRQGWETRAAPVLWSEQTRAGLIYKSTVFAHIPGGGAVESGIEPLFAWMRLSYAGCCPDLKLTDELGFQLLLQAAHPVASMNMRHSPVAISSQSRYPRELRVVGDPGQPTAGLRVLEPDDRVRLGVAPGRHALEVTFVLPTPGDSRTAHRLYVRMPARPGRHVDVLIPFAPADPAVFDQELALGYDGALRETDRYWTSIMRSRTRFSVPEPEIVDTARQSARFFHLLAERNPETGKYCKLTGSWVYADMWSTPSAMELVMLMDVLGHHQAVERYLEIFREEQGTVVPPGSAYTLHLGYLSTPARYKSVDWLTDNGSLLYALSMHGLLSGDAAYMRRFTDCIVKSCDWIKDSRALRGHGGVEGILPPAVATDVCKQIQAVWSDGWNYKGLCMAVRFLRSMGHPRAGEFACEADEYRRVFVAALRAKTRCMPSWTDARGKRHHFVPNSLMGDTTGELVQAFYLDCGPLFLVFAGLLRASDPLMRDTMRWFREGPQWQMYRRNSNCWQVAVLDHEMSSCEPCYSWNLFHTWQMADRARFLEGLYSLFTGSVSRQTRVSCETRGGITGLACPAALMTYLARLAVVDDELREDELHLLRLVPAAWLKPGDTCAFDHLPTLFGPITLRTTLSRDGRSLDVEFATRFRTPPARVVLHRPPLAGLEKVRVNGQPVRIVSGRVIIGCAGKPMV